MKEEIHSLEENHSLEEKHSTDLVEVIAKALVDNPEEVVVTEKSEGRNTVIELHVAPSDMGKVIGKQGRIAKAIRSVVKAASFREKKSVDVEIV
ncbi:MAG: KH domain-containing protein [Lachnospiraceae bacterium]|nr:KH domain-containing protein [uncultured Acetatifactor sp.]MCI8544181.1 KH domain-containing protein [Lachnospiraceae bacterium]